MNAAGIQTRLRKLCELVLLIVVLTGHARPVLSSPCLVRLLP